MPPVSEALDIDEAPALQTFSLTAFDIGDDGEEDIELVVHVPDRPSIHRHASMALLYGLAIMTLDQDGTLEARMNELLDAGAINEVDAVNKINLLLLKEENDQLV